MINKTIGNYKIISELGQGGMGVVYKAYDMHLKRYAALKILRPELIRDERFLTRFRREAQNQAQLSHPNIVPVYGMMEKPQASGIIMEYVEGKTLDDIIKEDLRLHYRDALFIIKQVLLGIEYAHSKGLIHRDIKPSNIILNRDAQVKIMDFGISKLSDQKDLTGTGKNVGTLFYMSPEQIHNEEPTPQSDIYSVGIMFYEMLAGTTPFNYGSDYEIIDGHLKKDPPPLKNYAPESPGWIEELIYRAISKKPQDRFESARAFFDEIEKYEQNEKNVALKDAKGRKFSRPGIQALRKKRQTLGYKIKTLSVSLLIVCLFGAFVYFVVTQVITLLNQDDIPLYGILKQKQTEAVIREEYKKDLEISVIHLPVSETLNSMWFAGDSLVFVCGNNGTLFRSADAMKSWTKTDLGSNVSLHDLVFLKNGRGLIAADSSGIFYTEDFGKSWRRRDLNYDKAFFRIKFSDDNTGLLTGNKGIILKTSDAGRNWYQVVSNSRNGIFDVDFVTARKLMAVDRDGYLLKSDNTGESWVKLNESGGSYLRCVKFKNRDIGFAGGGDGVILKTTDGGNSWRHSQGPVKNGLFDICFWGQTIFISASGGKIFFSSDMGESWRILKTGTYFNIMKFKISPSGKLYGCGANGSILEISRKIKK